MKDLQTWIERGLLELFLQGGVDAKLGAEIEQAAKLYPEVRAALRAAEENLRNRTIAELSKRDPQALIRSGKILSYAMGGLTQAERTEIEMMAFIFPEVTEAIDLLKRSIVNETVEKARHHDPQAFLASNVLVDYILGTLDEAGRQDVELMAYLHPAVAEELSSLQHVDEALAKDVIRPPHPRSRKRFMDFMEEAERQEKEAIIIRPPFLNTASTSADFAEWMDRDEMVPPSEFENLHVVPIDGSPDGLTMVVWVKSYIAEEVHLDSIEKFLVLEGACTIDVEGEVYTLKRGDFMSIPKFMRHTVQVTSDIPCKLIVQQVAA